MAASDYYPYDPSKAGAGIMMVLFGGSAIIHLWQLFKMKTWFFTAFLVGAFSLYSLSVNLRLEMALRDANHVSL
jgi:hypothetical protein